MKRNQVGSVHITVKGKDRHLSNICNQNIQRKNKNGEEGDMDLYTTQSHL